MSADPFRKPKAGDPLEIPAVVYGTLVDVAQAHQREGVVGPRPIRETPPGAVLVKNTSGADVPRFGALGIGGPLFTPPAFGDPGVAAELCARNRFAGHGYALEGVQTVHADHAAQYVIAAELIPDGKLGRAYASGLALTRVTLKNEGDGFATVVSSSNVLESSAKVGYPIVWIEDVAEDAVAWALVDLSRSPRKTWGRITGASSLGDNQWTYQWEEIRKTGAGYGAWSATGLTHTTLGLGYNLAEDGNTGDDVEGLGIDVDGAAADGFDVQPVATDRIVELELIRVTASVREAWFSVTNGFDGSCAE